MNGSFAWAELEEYISRNRERNIQHLKEILPESENSAEETFDNIKLDILLEKDQDAILESVKKSFENTQEKIIEKFGNTSTDKSTFELRQMFDNNIRPRTGKTNHCLDNALIKIATQGIDASWIVEYIPDSMWIDMDTLIPSSEELEGAMKGQLYGLSMDAIYFDELSVLNNPEEDKPKKKKNMRDDVRSFLNKGRKW